MNRAVSPKEKVVRFSDEVHPSEPPPLVMANHLARLNTRETDTATLIPQPDDEHVAETSFQD